MSKLKLDDVVMLVPVPVKEMWGEDEYGDSEITQEICYSMAGMVGVIKDIDECGYIVDLNESEGEVTNIYSSFELYKVGVL